MERLVGNSNEVDIELEGKSVTALLDTGSMISTISASMATNAELQCHRLDNLLQVEGEGDNL